MITMATQDQKNRIHLRIVAQRHQARKMPLFIHAIFLKMVIDIVGVNIMSLWSMFALWNTQEGEG
jgi:hypothetical protein